MKPRTLFIAIVATVLAPTTCLAAKAKRPAYPGECSAFSVAGDSAAVTVTPERVAVTITSAAGRRSQLSAPAGVDVRRARDYTYSIACMAVFSADGRYLAVGYNQKSPDRQVSTALHLLASAFRVIVVRLPAGKVKGDFVVSPGGPLRPPLMFVGFLQDQPRLLFLGIAPYEPLHAFSEVVFDVNGKQETPPTVRALPAHTSNFWIADALHNRLWLRSSPQYCPMLSVPLVGKETVTHVVDGPEIACDSIEPGAYPDSNTVVLTVSPDYPALIKIDLANHRAQKISLPRAPGNLTGGGFPLTSPDGQLVGVVRGLRSTAWPGGVSDHGYEIDVVQVAPLRVVGKLRLRADISGDSLSFDYHDGVAKVLGFNEGKNRWELRLLKVQ